MVVMIENILSPLTILMVMGIVSHGANETHEIIASHRLSETHANNASHFKDETQDEDASQTINETQPSIAKFNPKKGVISHGLQRIAKDLQ